MYKVLIAEDELLVRIGIKSSILQSDLPLTVAGDTSNGLSAYEMFISKRPDIVITDIKMPGLDGIELIRMIRKLDKDCSIIVISCLEEFDILKQVMENKATAYLLKATMTMDEIISSLKSAISELDKKNCSNVGTVKDIKIGTLIGNALSQYINGSLPQDVLVEELYKTGFVPERMAVFFYKERKLDAITRQTLEEAAVQHLSREYKTIYLAIDETCFIILMSAAKVENMLAIEQLRLFIQDTFSLNPTIIVKSLNGRLEHLPGLLKQCFAEEQEMRYFEVEHPVYDNWMSMLPNHINLMISNMSAENESINRLLGDCKNFKLQVEQIIFRASKGRVEFINSLFETIELFAPPDNEFIEVKTKIQDAKTCKDAIKICFDWLYDINYLQKPKYRRYEIVKAIDYIKDHYMEPITLKEIACYVGLAPNYFSNLFTREVGQNFIVYLNSVRIEHAKRLLMERSLLVYEVAHHVGFEDEAYFCRMFKKTTGKSPKSWRTKNNKNRRR